MTLFLFINTVNPDYQRLVSCTAAAGALAILLAGDSNTGNDTDNWWLLARWLVVDLLLQFIGISSPIKAVAARLYHTVTTHLPVQGPRAAVGAELQFAILVQTVLVFLATLFHGYMSLDAGRVFLGIATAQWVVHATLGFNPFGVVFRTLRRAGLVGCGIDGQPVRMWVQYAEDLGLGDAVQAALGGKARSSVVPSKSTSSSNVTQPGGGAKSSAVQPITSTQSTPMTEAPPVAKASTPAAGAPPSQSLPPAAAAAAAAAATAAAAAAVLPIPTRQPLASPPPAAAPIALPSPPPAEPDAAGAAAVAAAAAEPQSPPATTAPDGSGSAPAATTGAGESIGDGVAANVDVAAESDVAAPATKANGSPRHGTTTAAATLAATITSAMSCELEADGTATDDNLGTINRGDRRSVHLPHARLSSIVVNSDTPMVFDSSHSRTLSASPQSPSSDGSHSTKSSSSPAVRRSPAVGTGGTIAGTGITAAAAAAAATAPASSSAAAESTAAVTPASAEEAKAADGEPRSEAAPAPEAEAAMAAEAEAPAVQHPAVAVVPVGRQESDVSTMSEMIDFAEELVSAAAVSQQVNAAVAATRGSMAATPDSDVVAEAVRVLRSPMTRQVPKAAGATGAASPANGPVPSPEAKADVNNDGDGPAVHPVLTAPEPLLTRRKSLQPLRNASVPVIPAEEPTDGHVMFLDSTVRPVSMRGLNPENDPLLKATRSARNVMVANAFQRLADRSPRNPNNAGAGAGAVPRGNRRRSTGDTGGFARPTARGKLLGSGIPPPLQGATLFPKPSQANVKYRTGDSSDTAAAAAAAASGGLGLETALMDTNDNAVHHVFSPQTAAIKAMAQSKPAASWWVDALACGPVPDTVAYSETVYRSLLKKRAPWQAHPSRRRFSAIKYLDAIHFVMPTTWILVALLWKTTSLPFDQPSEVWDVLGAFSLAITFALGVLYTLKAAVRGYRVKEEWNDFNTTHGFAYPPIALLLLSYVAVDWEEVMAWWLLYIGSTLAAMLAITSFSRLMHEHRFIDHLNPQYLLPSLAALVASYASARVLPDYVEVAWLWFATGIVPGMLVMTVMVLRLATRPPVGVGTQLAAMSATLVSWFAASALASFELAPLAVTAPLPTAGRLFCMAGWFVALVLLYASGQPGPWAASHFSILSWQYGVAGALLTLATAEYHTMVGGDVSERLVWAGAFVTAVAIIKLTVHTLVGLAIRKWVFVPRPRLSPLCVVTLAYPALTNTCGKLAAAIGHALTATTPEAWRSCVKLARHELAVLKLLFTESTHQEHTVVLPVVGSLLACTLPKLGADILRLADRMSEVQAAVLSVPLVYSDSSSSTRDDLHTLLASVNQLATALEAHCHVKETRIMPIAAQFLSHQAAVRTQQRVWRSTAIDRWRFIVPAVLNSLSDEEAVRYLSAWRLGMEEHMQLLGQMVYEGVTHDKWEALTHVMPELVPAFVDGHRGGFND